MTKGISNLLSTSPKETARRIWRFPKIRGTILGFPIITTYNDYSILGWLLGTLNPKHGTLNPKPSSPYKLTIT